MNKIPFDSYTEPYCILDFTSWPTCFYNICEDEFKRIGPHDTNAVKIESFRKRPDHSRLSVFEVMKSCLGCTRRPISSDTTECIDIKDEPVIKHIILHFFEWTGGYVNHFHTLTADDFNEIFEEKDVVNRISSIFAGRPIKTKMLTQRLRQNDFNSPLNIFMREYVDFKMYTADDRINRANGYPSKAMTITPKLLNCEFLIFHNLLKNAEVLRDKYKGWGLVVHLPDPKLGFDFYLQNFQKWYSGEEAKLKYLMLACDFSPDEWSRLCSLGEEDIKPYGTRFVGTVYTFKEFKITRKDGEICHIGVMEETILYFYLGETTEGILRFTYDTTLTNV